MARRRQSALDKRRSATGDKPRRRRWWLLLLLLLLLLFLKCDPEPPLSELELPSVGQPAALMPAPPPPAPEPPATRVPRRDRAAFAGVVPEQLPWLAAFRLQVAARSPRLAECFLGASRPGALKWTAAVEPQHGRVSDPTLEPTLSSDALTRVQRACVLAALSEPPYQLDAGEAPSTPSRVGMVIEF